MDKVNATPKDTWKDFPKVLPIKNMEVLVERDIDEGPNIFEVGVLKSGGRLGDYWFLPEQEVQPNHTYVVRWQIQEVSVTPSPE